MLLFLAGGCTQAVTLADWRASVERYIDTVGQGDPNVLREVTWPQSRRAFSVIDDETPAKGQDVRGLLLASQQIDGQRWFVFLVGIVNQQVVRDLRVVALNPRGATERIWRSGPPAPEEVETYLEYKQKLWQKRFPGRSSPAPQYTVFPQEDDVFRVDVEGGRVLVTHQASGAHWELLLESTGSPSPATRPAGPVSAAIR